MNQNIRFDNKPSNHAGFTFVELIITILVLGIMASLAIYNGSRITSPHKRSLALQQVIDDINYARTLAISTNELITIEFSDSDDDYRIFKGQSNIPVQDFPNGVSGVVDFLNLNLGPTDLSNVNFDGTNRLRLLPDGVPEFGGTLTINNVTLTVNALTGKCSIN